jgi:hypothetical protein
MTFVVVQRRLVAESLERRVGIEVDFDVPGVVVQLAHVPSIPRACTSIQHVLYTRTVASVTEIRSGSATIGRSWPYHRAASAQRHRKPATPCWIASRR